MPFFNSAGKSLQVKNQFVSTKDVLTRATSYGSYSVNYTGNCPGIRISPDGSKMFILGAPGDGSTTSVTEFSLSKAWDISTATLTSNAYCNVSSTISGTSTSALDFALSVNGNYLYVIDQSGNNPFVYQFNMSIPYTVNTAVLTNTFDIPTITTVATICFKTDGSVLYLSSLGTDTIYSYSLSTAWNVATASAITNISILNEGTIRGMAFNASGTALYYAGDTNNAVRRYNLSTPWDISTYSAHSTIRTATSPTSLDISPDGTRIFVGSAGTSGNRTITQYITK